MTSGNQYVNLPRHDNWVDGSDITNIDRLSVNPRIKVKFDKVRTYNVKVKMLVGSANEVYSTAEQGRNTHFKFQVKTYITDADGTKVLPLADFYLNAAGKNTFKLEAEDDRGHKVSTGEL